MTKQTAVEWLIEQMLKQGYFDVNKPLTFTNLDHLQQQAKEMEKEQIVTTWNTAHQAGRFEGKGIAEENWQTFESYWKETFKSE
jgi:hypothetical protein